MNYISAQDAATKWGISKRRVQVLCATGRINGAVRIGNMWVLPAGAMKPVDSRCKKAQDNAQKQRKSPIQAMRNKIRTNTQQIVKLLLATGMDKHRVKMATITFFAAGILLYYEDSKADIARQEEAALTIGKVTGALAAKDAFRIPAADWKRVRDVIDEYPYCIDDALSWCYQYCSKFLRDGAFGNTQFFTEKYMITTLVDNVDLTTVNKVLDPACGGANFLLYCFDIYMERMEQAESNCGSDSLRRYLRQILSKLYGYEIDSDLAAVASINLRLKALAWLSKLEQSVCENDFLSLVPCIFSPMRSTVAGSLDIDSAKQVVIQCGSEQHVFLADVLTNVDVVFTNPPFKTIKGMPEELKVYLKSNYPRAKCDMCNAFLEMALSTVNANGVVGFVSQNSWFFLESFKEFRRHLLSHYSITHIWELGTNAFLDLSGEKANVALVICKNAAPKDNSEIRVTSLKDMDRQEAIAQLSAQSVDAAYCHTIMQRSVEDGPLRFDATGTEHLQAILKDVPGYGDSGIPMQGTSTGNAKELIDFYWKHIGDSEWVPVSKGGGYSRWQGLNHYCVKWGKDGEYIRATKGSAIRNASYFGETQLVFSDTGTAGLNVRVLLPGQIFVASGPGIRGLHGNKLAHLAFLNSRLASYYIRQLSPKLTVAAGYISKLPASNDIFSSEQLEVYSASCLQRKQRRLRKRANNMEFCYFSHTRGSPSECARRWFVEDIWDEWQQLCDEQAIENVLADLMELTDEDLRIINSCIGEKHVKKVSSSEKVDFDALDSILQKTLDVNCVLTRTKAVKNALGCDGVLEYTSQKTGISCETIFNCLIDENYYPEWLADRYLSLYYHGLVLSTMKYKTKCCLSSTSAEIAEAAGLYDKKDVMQFELWLKSRFNPIHQAAFWGAPLFHYDAKTDSVQFLRRPMNG